jgi:leucyl/phenylalanyl-tRNA--protein transferase
MRSLFVLQNEDLVFPHPSCADKTGLLAIMGETSPERLLLAYQYGIFPWFNPGQIPMWYCPQPRFVVYPQKVKIHKSMKPYFNQEKFQVTYNTQFESVMSHCKDSTRQGYESESWISDEFIDSYTQLHKMGYAQSVEVWDGENLVGGLYGVRIGRIFFGESMFALKANASKFGFIKLAQKLESEGCVLIDCQQETDHLRSLGGELIEGDLFMNYLRENRLYFLGSS